MFKKTNSIVLFLWLLVLLVPSVVAGDDLKLSISGTSKFTDNARKVSTNKIDERQDKLSLGVSSIYQNNYTDINFDYTASRYTYSEDTQDTQDSLEGHADIKLGKPNDIFGLLLSHSQSIVLKNSSSIDLQENTDERQILTVRPDLSLRLSGVDRLILSAEQTEVKYRSNTGVDSKRSGLSSRWAHQLSSIDNFSLSLNSVDVEFKDRPINDYSFKSATVAYKANLKRLSYRVEAGYNQMVRTDSDGFGQNLRKEDYDSPTYNVDLGYVHGDNQFAMNARQILTDTSIGAGNLTGSGSGNVESSKKIFDRYELTTAGINWSNGGVCEVCTVGLSLSAKKEVYEILPEDGLQLSARIFFDYSLSALSSLKITLSQEDYNYDDSALLADYGIIRSKLSYSYLSALGINLGLYAQLSERTSDVGLREYDENSVGINVRYSY